MLLTSDTALTANTGKLKDLRREARSLKEIVSQKELELHVLKDE